MKRLSRCGRDRATSWWLAAIRWLGIAAPPSRRVQYTSKVPRSPVLGKLSKHKRRQLGLANFRREDVWERVRVQDSVHLATVRTLRAGRRWSPVRTLRARWAAFADRAWMTWRRWRAAV